MDSRKFWHPKEWNCRQINKRNNYHNRKHHPPGISFQLSTGYSQQGAQIYQHWKASHDSKHIKNQKDDVLIARLRSGQHPYLHQCLYQLDRVIYAIYPSCRLQKQYLTYQLCNCPARDTMFGCSYECLGATKGPWCALPLNLEKWWRTLGRPSIIFIIFWDILMFYQIFFSPQVKRCAIIT